MGRQGNTVDGRTERRQCRSADPAGDAVLAKQAGHLSEGERDLILHDNVAELYGLERP